MNHNMKVFDTDPLFIVDAVTRAIKNMSQSKVSIIQGDHNSERFTFQLPRYIEEHDMMESSKVEIHFINSGSGQSKGVYTVDDLSINDEDTSTVKCSWLLSKATTSYSGKLAFKIRFVCFADDGVTVAYEWNTAPFTGISVGEGMDCSDAVTDEEYNDIIEQWKNDLKAELKGWIDDEVSSQVDLVQIQKNAQDIDTLTDEQKLLKSRIDNMAHLEEGSTTADAELLDIRVDHEGNTFPSAGDAVREASKKAAQSIAEMAKFNARAIICKAEGKSPTVTDSVSDEEFKGLKIYGRTDQIHTKGENLFDVFSVTQASNGTCVLDVPGTGCLKTTILKKGSPQMASVTIPLPLDSPGNLYLKVKVRCSSSELTVPELRIRLSSSTDDSVVTYIKNFSGISTDWGNAMCVIPISDSQMKTYDLISLLMYVKTGSAVIENVGEYVELKDIMLSTTDSEYEPYSGLEPSPSPAYPQELKTIADGGSVSVDVHGTVAVFATPNGLPGIPVTVGGNYTDENGQMWIADEVDAEKGVYIQRVCMEELTFHENNGRYETSLTNNANVLCASGNGIPVLCDKYIFEENADEGTNGIRVDATSPSTVIAYYNGEVIDTASVIYPLEYAIQTQLTEEEIAAYKGLKTHKPVTTIINDANAHIEADYVADTKAYIDNKFAELASAIINNS